MEKEREREKRMSHIWKGDLAVAFLKWKMVETLFFYKHTCCSSTVENDQNKDGLTSFQPIYLETRHVCAVRFNVSCILQRIYFDPDKIWYFYTDILRQNANFCSAKSKWSDRFTYQSVSDGHQFVANDKTTVYLSGSAIHDFGYVNPIVTWYMLIADTAGNAEAEALVTLDKLNLH